VKSGTGFASTSGLLPAPELGRGFAMNGRADSAFIVDLKTFNKIGTIKSGKDPDSFAYEPVRSDSHFLGKLATAEPIDES
jgi:hypothetical protein